MGRFFETAPTQFVEDFIYQPPWEIIQQNNMLKAQNYATQQQTFNLLNNLPIDFWDKPDSELAKAKQEEYRNLAQPLIETFKKDPSNKQAEMQLHDLANKVYKDYTFGDLAKIRKNKEQHDKFMEYAEKLPPGDKEVFLRQVDNYLKPNQDGSMNNAFTKQFDFMEHQNMIKGEDYFKTDRFKTLEADITSSAGVNIGGQWITKTSSNIEELTQAKIAEDMKAWLQEQNLDKNNWDKYWTQVGGIQNLYDKEGKLGFEKGTYLGDMIEAGSKTHAYKKSKSDKDVDVNQWTMHEDEQAFEASESEKQFKRNLILANTKSGSSEGSDSDAESNAVAGNFKLPEPVRKDIANISKIQGELKEEIEATFGPLAAKTTGKNKVNAMTFYHKLINNSKYWKEKNS